MRWLLIFSLLVFSMITAGCEKGSLGVKSSTIKGYVLDISNSQPIPEVAIQAAFTNTTNQTYSYKSYLTGGDGSYLIPDLTKGDYSLTPEKFGWVATPTVQPQLLHVTDGETIQAPIIWMEKKSSSVKGTLRGYPIDAVTGAPLQTFTISQKDPAKYKIFETSQDFKEAGWTGLEGGDRTYTITCENYKAYVATAAISITPWELGIIRMNPEVVAISGTVRNLPGYIIGDSGSNLSMQVWAESANKVIATGTITGAGGLAQYTISNVPVTVGNVAVKCKVRGYDVAVISASLSIPKQRPTGIIGGVDIDFANIEPIKRDVRVVVRGNKPADAQTASTVDNGDIIRVYIRQGGKDIVPYVDVVGNNYLAEAYFTGVVTGYKLSFLAVNLNRGYNSKKEEEVILEDGGTAYTLEILLQSS